jgi:hypothetical protein
MTICSKQLYLKVNRSTKGFRAVLLIFLILLSTAALQQGAAAQPYINPDCQANLNIEFEADETLFTFLAWMSWVSDDTNPLKIRQFPEQEEIKQSLKSIPKEVYFKHRQAYVKYMSGPGSSYQDALVDLMKYSKEKTFYEKYRLANTRNYVKNDLLISDSQYYDYPPFFNLMPVDKQQNPRLRNLPAPELLKEFYELANIGELWRTEYRNANLRMIEKYAGNSRKLLEEVLCFLRMKQEHPVSIRFNRLDSFGTSGQTTFSPWEKKFIIKINLEPDARDDYILQVIRHEFAHSLLNEAVKANRTLIDASLKKVAARLNLDTSISPEELLAQCIGNLQYVKANLFIRENIHFYYKNILFMHFTEKMPEFLNSGKSYAEFIPELFKTFDPDKEITRWENIERRVNGHDLIYQENL